MQMRNLTSGLINKPGMANYPDQGVKDYGVFLPLKIVFTIANIVDPDEMPHIAAFHLGLHCLQRTHLGVSSLKRVKPKLDLTLFIILAFFSVSLLKMILLKYS